MLEKYLTNLLNVKLFLILILAVFLRFWDISGNPSGLYVDEALQGYNAYSLGLTGRDHYGKPFPLATKMFSTYSSPLYTYFSVLPVKILGLNILSVRFTSALIGVLIVLLSTIAFGGWVGLIIATSPVFVFYSRGAFEANLGLFFLLTAFIFLKRHSHFFAFLFLALSAYSYHAEKLLFIPLFILFLYISRSLKYAGTFALVLPLFYLSLFSFVDARFSELAIRPEQLFTNLLPYFSPDNLFSRPDPDLQRSFPELSVFYWWMFVSLIIGFCRKLHFNVLFLTLLFLVPGILTKDYFSTVRVLPFFFMLAYFIGQGLKNLSPTINIILACFFAASLLSLYSNLLLLKHERSNVWGYPSRQLFSFLKTLSDQSVFLDNSRQKPQYILYAFYHQIPPQAIQTTLTIPDYYQNISFDPSFRLNNLTINSFNWERDLPLYRFFIGDTLSISPAQAHEHHLKLYHQFFDLTGTPALQIWAKD